MTRDIKLSDLLLEHPLWKNPRTITALSASDLADLGEDLIDRGQKVPLLVQQIKNEDGSISNLVLDGQRRCLALARICKLRKKGESTVTLKADDFVESPIELTVESSDRMFLDALAVGIKRAGLSAYEQTEAAVQLRLRHPDWTMATIGKALSRSESWVSRFTRARKLACAALVQAWAKGKVTDEQFKDLAEVNPWDRQEEALAEALGIKAKGGRGAAAEARHKIKAEKDKAKEKKREEKKASGKKSKKKAKAKPATGDNGEMIFAAKKPEIADIVALANVKKPTDPYTKGLMDGLHFAVGEKDASDFAPAWRTYLKQLVKRGDITVEN